MRMLCRLGAIALLGSLLAGCAVVGAAGVVAGAAVDVGATAVEVGADTVGAVAGAATGGSSSMKDDKKSDN